MKKAKILFLGAFTVLVLTACTEKPIETSNKNVIEAEKDVSVTTQTTENLSSGTYRINASDSSLEWFATKIISNAHPGFIDIKNGTLIWDNGKLVGGEFIIDMTTMRDVDNNERLINHLKSSDFFDVEIYPESKFTISDAQIISENEDGSSNYKIIGALMIKNISNNIEFDAVIGSENNKIYATADFSIDRTKWDLTYGSGQFFKELGDKAIKDEIDYKISLEAELVD